MIQVYADGVLAYDSRLENYDLAGLSVTKGLNTGGTAEITMPYGHPAYSLFVSHKTIVTVFRDGVLRFRGRALYSADNYNGQRSITCEGEMCFLRDTINRPYLYQATPRSCFVTLINAHNGATDSTKKFVVGDVTVTDPNDYIRLESESAETTLATINKLVERCGGYIVFKDTEDGNRAIHWLGSLDQQSEQSVEFGENLLDFTSTGANTTSLITGLVPYGAKDEETGKRITIAPVNGGKDYIIAEDAKAIRGLIMGTNTWDDVTEPANLLKKARAYLEEHKVFITSLSLTALDLSYLDKDMDSFAVGDMIRVISVPHGVNEFFQLTQMTENLLNPAQSTITLGKDVLTLTSADVAGDNKGQSAVASVKSEIKADVNAEMQQAAAQLEEVWAPRIAEEVGAAVIEQVSKDYAQRSELEALGESTRKALSDHEVEAVKTFATKEELADHEVEAADTFATKEELATHEKVASETYATKEELEALTPAEPGDPSIYATKEELTAHETAAAETYATKEALSTEVSARAGAINKVNGTVHLSGGAPINILGGKIDIDGSEINFKKEARFLNESGIRIADKDGNSYYVLRVDASNNCFVGNDYTELYLRAKTAVYLHKTGATVTSDAREKENIGELSDAYVEMLDKLTPVRFTYKDRDPDKYHVGFTAQDVAAAMASAKLGVNDFGGFVDLNGDGSMLGLAYDEFIGLLLEKIRRLEKRIDAMEG